MFLVNILKHSVELLVALVVCYIGAVILFPSASAVANSLLADSSDSSYSGPHIHIYPSYRSYGTGATMIRPSFRSSFSFRGRL